MGQVKGMNMTHICYISAIRRLADGVLICPPYHNFLRNIDKFLSW